VSVQDRCTVCAKVPLAQKSFCMHPMILRGDKAQLEIMLILTQDWCMVCAEHTIGLEIVLDAYDRTAW
jgi:carbonic anhydrase/acetyltransferase-like protein (isoleucine patch superfamily)